MMEKHKENKMADEDIVKSHSEKWAEAERELSIQEYELARWIAGYITEQFIYDPKELPDDECANEAITIIKYIRLKGFKLAK